NVSEMRRPRSLCFITSSQLHRNRSRFLQRFKERKGQQSPCWPQKKQIIRFSVSVLSLSRIPSVSGSAVSPLWFQRNGGRGLPPMFPARCPVAKKVVVRTVGWRGVFCRLGAGTRYA